MNRSNLFSVIAIGLMLLLINKESIAQIPNFGTAANFAIFTSSGAVANTGILNITGDIGTSAGAISDFNGESTLRGNLYSANNVTTQASADLLTAYNQLYNTVTTNTSHTSLFGNNETLPGGVYAINSAASASGVLNLDAGGDNTKIFIFKINGAFNTAAGTTIILLNGATACNIFWVVEGAIAMAANTNMAGTLLAHGEANSMGAGCSLIGRMYSTSGAVSVNHVTIAIPTGCVVPAPNCNNSPVITVQPSSAKICNGDPYTFKVAVTGDNLSYQWRKDGVDILGATASTYTIASTSPANAGLYYVVIVGSCSPFAASQIDTLFIASPGVSLASTANFLIFSSSGAISNTGVSNLTGNIGTDAGAITGFESSTVNGICHGADSVAARCVIDLQNLYNQLNVTSATNTTHVAAFGNGETLTPGVYSIASAGSIAGNLILDAGGDANKIFIFKIGGAFSTGAQSKVSLINNASSCNIFWVAEGAAAMGAGTTMKGTVIAHDAAISMAAGGNLEGRLFSTSGAAAFDNLTATLPTGGLQGTRWTGAVSTDWFTTCNWYYGLIPNDTTIITIPAGLPFYPVINTGIAHVENILIEPNASLTVSNANLIIKGTIINNGSFDASAGTITMAGATIQTITSNTFTNNTVQNLVIGNDVTLAGPLNVTGAISFPAQNKLFKTFDFLTIKSGEFTTASIGNLNGNKFTGMVTAELFISKKRAWRLLSGQVCAPGSVTIKEAWQEGSNTGNPAPGCGTQITGGSLINGFDQGINKNAGIKVYNNSDDTFIGLPDSSGTNTPLTNYPGYFLFTRGDRSTNLFLGVNAPITATTLRVKGPINFGDIDQTVNATNFTLIGNPYLESIDFGTITKKNVANKFYVWDPKLGGARGVGGYVSFMWNGTSYVGTSAISPESQYIPYGAAFFVESEDGINSGLLTIKETDKTVLGNDEVFRPYLNTPTIRVDLLGINADSSSYLIDGIVTTYALGNNNGLDKNDARKMYNLSENICLAREGKNLAIESRKTISGTDTSFIKIYKLKKKLYKLSIQTAALDSIGLTIVLKDNYLPANNNLPVNKNGTTVIYFTVNADTSSFSANRFSIVFKKIEKLPLRFIDFNASQHERNILLKWKTINEANVKGYEVQQSADSINFSKLTTIVVNPGSHKAGSYGWLALDVKEGKQFFRIKSINTAEDLAFSSIVNIAMDKNTASKNLIVIGNPIQLNNLKFGFSNVATGLYKLEVYNMDGQLIKQGSITHSGGNFIYNFMMPGNTAKGKYRLVLLGQEAIYSTDFIK